jgi:hypothetical protein
MTNSHDEHPHPSDVTAAETQTMRRRMGLGLAIAVGLNVLFLTGGAMVASYLTNVFHPFFFPKDKIVFVRLDVTPSPSPSPKPSASPR